MAFREYKYLVRSDLYRHAAGTDIRSFLVNLLLNPGFKYSFLMRSCAFLRDKFPWRYTLYACARLLLRHFTFKYGISIPYDTQVGPGFYIGHFGGIVVHHKTVIGRNCNISQGVTIGISNRGAYEGTPCIGDNVYIGPGAKIFGRITVGNNAAIGANSVVTKNVPENGVVAGAPARLVSMKGSEGYVVNTAY